VTAESRRRPAVERVAAVLGALSFIVIALGCVWSALGYTGTAGEPYSPLNHWISELGQEGVAARADWFNRALILGGAGFIGFVVGLAWTSPTRLRWVFGPVGVVAGIGGICVGLFPMNHPDQHVIAASTFFNLGWIFVALASIAFVRHREPRHPAWLAVVGGASAAAFIAFLVSLRTDEFSRQRMASTGAITGRPDVWIAPILEWATLITIVAWVLLASVAWLSELRQPRRESAALRGVTP
jgi:hypothetical membrane protein